MAKWPSGGTWRRPPSGTFTLEFEYWFIVACLMVDQDIVYIVYIALFVVCCVCVITFEHLLFIVSCCATLLIKFLSCLSYFGSVAVVYVGGMFCEIGYGLGLYCFLLCTSLLFETRLSISF